MPMRTLYAYRSRMGHTPPPVCVVALCVLGNDGRHMVDVVVIGAGVAGCAVARELSRLDLDIVVVERGHDVACGATRSNSAIVHGGFDPEPGTLKARYNVAGARMIPQLSRELGFRYKNNGSLVVALADGDMDRVHELYERGLANGVEGLRVLDANELRALEPNVAPEARGALLCESAGICDPFGMCIALAENAVTNGATFRFNENVEDITRQDDGTWELQLKAADKSTPSTLTARTVVNAAGTSACDLHNLVSAHKLDARPRLGEYVLLSRERGDTFSHTMFQVPGPLGKGVLVSPTVEGNLIVGPDALDIDDPLDTSTRRDGLDVVVASARRTWPGLSERDVIVNFAGVRASGADGDFVIGEPDDAPGFYDIAAFDSPGLTSAVAVAADLAPSIGSYLNAPARADFIATREQPPRFIEMSEDERAAAIARDPRFGHIICRCELVSEAEVLAAIHAPIPATTVDGVKRRCRAGTGMCQGGFCGPTVARLIAIELGIPLSQVCISGPGTSMAPYARGEE